jgi:hypothetical protein
LQQTDEQIKGAKANLGITQSQDAVTLLKTRYAVRSAELNVQKNDVTDLIDAKKNLLALEESKRAVTQMELDIAARQAQNDSILAVLAEARGRSLLDVTREEQRIAQTKELAEITGLVSIRQNRAGNFNFGQVMPVIREGDTLQPGMPVADILDLSEVEVWAKVGELDRANLTEGQDAVLRLDSIPDKQFHGKIKTLSGTASADVFSGDPAKKFDVVFSVDMRALLNGLGMKPADVDRVMATAQANATKKVDYTASSPFASFQLPPAGAPGVPSGGPAGMAGRGRGPGGAMPSGTPPAGRGPASATPPKSGLVPGSAAHPPTAADLMEILGQSVSKFTEEERNNAKLPLPPEQDSQVQALLRPGLLADVEIVVEKLPNVIHVPAQAVFQKGGKPIVYVQQNNGRFVAREVRLGKQSESMMVLSSGVEPGEIVALGDPTADKSAKKEEKKPSSNPMSSMPGGK